MAKILVVEDESIIGAVIRDKVEGMGHSVCGMASTGEKAIKLTEEKQPDVVLMDIILIGNMDGIETARRIQERFQTPVIYLSAFDDEDTRKRAIATKPVAYLVKLLDDGELDAAIERAVQGGALSHSDNSDGAANST